MFWQLFVIFFPFSLAVIIAVVWLIAKLICQEDGRIVRTGDISLAKQLEQEGYRGISAS